MPCLAGLAVNPQMGSVGSMPQGSTNQVPGTTLRSDCIEAEDAADHDAVLQHVVVVLIVSDRSAFDRERRASSDRRVRIGRNRPYPTALDQRRSLDPHQQGGVTRECPGPSSTTSDGPSFLAARRCHLLCRTARLVRPS